MGPHGGLLTQAGRVGKGFQEEMKWELRLEG